MFRAAHSKAQRAIDKYGMHMVVANLLQTRYKQVLLVSPIIPGGSQTCCQVRAGRTLLVWRAWSLYTFPAGAAPEVVE